MAPAAVRSPPRTWVCCWSLQAAPGAGRERLLWQGLLGQPGALLCASGAGRWKFGTLRTSPTLLTLLPVPPVDAGTCIVVRCEPWVYSRVSLMASIWALTLVGTAWKTSGENSSVAVALAWTFWYLKFKQERGEHGEKKLYLVHMMIRCRYFGVIRCFLLL